MQQIAQLKWSDLKTPTMTIDDYLKEFTPKPEILKHYFNYKPKISILDHINSLISEKKEFVKILAIGASWCPDCTANVPKMIKTIQELNKSSDKPISDLRILYGIKVNALHKKDELIWAERHSPPEALNPKFDLKKIPTIYFFDRNGKFLGRIIEKPPVDSTLEEEMLKILQNHL